MNMRTYQDTATIRQGKKSNLWMWIIVAIAAPLLMLVVAFGPSVLWALGVYIFMMLPEGSDPVYNGIKLGVSEKKVWKIFAGYEINGEQGSQPEVAPLPRNFFVLINGEPKALADVRPADLLGEGFKEGHGYYSAGGQGGSWATFEGGELRTMLLRKTHGTLKFSSSPSGPFLSLPVSFSEFQEQFGKPVRWEKQYPSRRFAP